MAAEGFLRILELIECYILLAKVSQNSYYFVKNVNENVRLRWIIMNIHAFERPINLLVPDFH